MAWTVSGTATTVEPVVPERRPARAKLNLFLHVLGRRPNGYHELDSLIVFTGLADGVSAAAADRLSLTRTGAFAGRLAASLAADDDDLMLRAARALAPGRGAALGLEKNLPPAAGMGGGSSDAAAALRALVSLWRLDMDEASLAEIGLGLGADVPACLAQPGAVRIGGVGERVSPIGPIPPAPVLVVNPGVALSTAEVFRAREGGWSPPAPAWDGASTVADLAAWLAPLGNDLEAPARRLAPVVDEVLARLRTLPGVLLARMSGGGATCFALFDTGAAAGAARDLVQAERPGWWCRATCLAVGDEAAVTP